jgi:hypothetical protein
MCISTCSPTTVTTLIAITVDHLRTASLKMFINKYATTAKAVSFGCDALTHYEFEDIDVG